jgi:hypothetical protein
MFDPTQQHAQMRQAVREEIELFLMMAPTQHAVDHEFVEKMRALLDREESERRAEDADRRKVRRRALWAVVVAVLTGGGGIGVFFNWEQLPAALSLLTGG